MLPELETLLESHPHSGYLRFHLPRYRSLLAALVERLSSDSRVLDIGWSPFAEALRARFDAVDTLGFGYDEQQAGGRHYVFDLNDCRDRQLWRDDLPRYDAIVFAEVLEHLYTAPSQVLGFLKSLLADDGLIFIQTPNAAVLPKRIKLLLGRNPYELIRENPGNPGHFREYTRRELEQYLSEGGWQLEHFSYDTYFDFRYAWHGEAAQLEPRHSRQLYNAVFALLPGSLKPGMFAIARKPAPPPPA